MSETCQHELGDVSTFEARLRSIQSYAKENGYAGGFPTFVDSKEGDRTIGVVLLNPSIAEATSIPVDELR